MSVRTNDPKEPEIYPLPKCTEPKCGKLYDSICKRCNLAYCWAHLLGPVIPAHTCIHHGVGFCDSIQASGNGKKKKST